MHGESEVALEGIEETSHERVLMALPSWLNGEEAPWAFHTIFSL